MKRIFAALFAFSLCFKVLAANTNGWLEVLDNPLAKAHAENKEILINFTGSDWSIGSVKFKTEALESPEFKSYANKNLELVEIDFPTNKPQTETIKHANEAWKQRYAVRIFPTMILTDSNGRELGRQVGYAPGGGAEFIKKMEQWKAATMVQDADAGKWTTDVPAALTKAKALKKLVLLDFTGSDWCGWCMKLDADVFSKAEFIDYAKKNLVLVQLDYPNQKSQPDALKNANAALKSKYKIEGFPTLIALKADGTVAMRIDGYLDGGPSALIRRLEAARQR